MKKEESTSFTIKCECSAYKNGLLVTSKKKSKLSNLQLNYQEKIITIIPLNSKDEEVVFELKRLKHIHRKFVKEGKITLEFTEEIDKNKSMHKLSSEENKVERLSQIFVEAASYENLELLINKIIELKKEIISKTEQIKKQSLPTSIEKLPSKINLKKKSLSTEDEVAINQSYPSLINQNTFEKKPESQYPRMEKFNEGLMSRKKDPLKFNQQLKEYERDLQQNNSVKLSRKEQMKKALLPTEMIEKPLIFLETKEIRGREVDILELPSILLEKIFEYTKVELRHRLISRKFDSFVLKNVKELKFHDEIDEQTFNKLAKFTMNVRGRLKNVRSLELIDLHDDRELEKNRSKSFYFGEWKEMSKKNIQQIKGLRVYLLEMPYQIKFSFDVLYGIRLKELHLVSRTEVTTQNSLISDENLIYLFKHVNELEAFSIPYINSIVLEELSTKLKEKTKKLKVLKIGSLNENCKSEESWWIMHIYENLQKLEIHKVLKGGIWKSETRYAFTFPEHLQELTLGSVGSQETLTSLPTTLTNLKLTGENFYNNDVADIYLPYLKVLDLSECTKVRPSIIDLLERCNKIKIITNWEKQDIEYWKEMATNKNIEIISIRGMIKTR